MTGIDRHAEQLQRIKEMRLLIMAHTDFVRKFTAYAAKSLCSKGLSHEGAAPLHIADVICKCLQYVVVALPNATAPC